MPALKLACICLRPPKGRGASQRRRCCFSGDTALDKHFINNLQVFIYSFFLAYQETDGRISSFDVAFLIWLPIIWISSQTAFGFSRSNGHCHTLAAGGGLKQQHNKTIQCWSWWFDPVRALASEEPLHNQHRFWAEYCNHLADNLWVPSNEPLT